MNYPKTSIELSGKTFARAIDRYPLVVVVCIPTMEYTFGNPLPVIETMVKEYEGKVIFGLLNTEENKKIAQNYDVTTTPTFLIFKDRRLVGYLNNGVTRGEIEEKINQYL